METPRVAIVLLNWNGAEWTIPCVASLRQQTYQNIQIIVVDNGSKDVSIERLQAECGSSIVLLPLATNQGFTGGNNVGIERALRDGADYVLVLNNDTEAHPDMVRELVAAAESDDRAAVVTAKIYYHGTKDTLWFAGGDVRRGWLLRFVHRGLNHSDTGQYDKAVESPFISGCCMLIRRKVLETVGMLDDRYFIYVEDGDYCLRVAAAGWRLLYNPRAVLWHKEAATVHKNTLLDDIERVSPFQHYLGTRNRLWTARKHGTQREKCFTVVAFALRIVARTPVFLARRRRKSLAALWKGLRDGVLTRL